jgi:hypothetical protein
MKMFDSQSPITIQLRGPEGTKSVKVRFPTDEEWIERQRRRKIIIKQLGRGVSETTISGGVVPEGAGFRVLLRVPGGTTAHLLRMPSAKDVIEYRRGFARILDLPFNRQELTVNLARAPLPAVSHLLVTPPRRVMRPRAVSGRA